jgi:hypothetical protein
VPPDLGLGCVRRVLHLLEKCPPSSVTLAEMLCQL